MKAPNIAPKAPPLPPIKLAPPRTKAVIPKSVYFVPCKGSPDPINAVKAIADKPINIPAMAWAIILTQFILTPLVYAALSSDPIKRKCPQKAVWVIK